MPTISIYQAEKDWLQSLKTSDPSRDSYAEALHHVRETYQQQVPPPIPALPLRIIIIVPADRYSGGLIHSEAGDYTEAQARAQADKWQLSMNTWLRVQAGVKADFRIHMIFSQHPTVDFYDPAGTGLNQSFIAEQVVPLEGDVPNTELQGWNAYRHSYIVISDRGGHAAGVCVSLNPNHTFADIGKSWMGDWQFSSLITGQYHAEMLTVNPAPGEIGQGSLTGGPWSHEVCHSLGMYVHASDWLDQGEFAVPFHEQIDPRFSTMPLNVGPDGEQIRLETSLLPGQRAQAKKYSARFLKAV